MHFGDKLFSKIREKETFLCLGLDPHLDLIPQVFQKENEITKEILWVNLTILNLRRKLLYS